MSYPKINGFGVKDNPLIYSPFANNSISAISPFSPLDIFGCVLWLDGNDPDGNTIKPADGSSIASWFDKSLNSNTFTQSNASIQPIYESNFYNGLGAINADIGNQWLQLPYTAVLNPPECTAFVVSQSMYNGDFQGLYSSRNGSGGVSTGYNFYANTGLNNRYEGWIGDGSSGFISVNDGAITANSSLLSMRIVGTTAFFYRDGLAFGSLANFVPMLNGQQNIFAIEGGFFRALGFIAEIIVYNSSLSDPNLDAVTTYLKERWGIA